MKLYGGRRCNINVTYDAMTKITDVVVVIGEQVNSGVTRIDFYMVNIITLIKAIMIQCLAVVILEIY